MNELELCEFKKTTQYGCHKQRCLIFSRCTSLNEEDTMFLPYRMQNILSKQIRIAPLHLPAPFCLLVEAEIIHENWVKRASNNNFIYKNNSWILLTGRTSDAAETQENTYSMKQPATMIEDEIVGSLVSLSKKRLTRSERTALTDAIQFWRYKMQLDT